MAEEARAHRTTTDAEFLAETEVELERKARRMLIPIQIDEPF